MFSSRVFKVFAVLGTLVGVFVCSDSVEAGGLRHRCCAIACRPVPCPVVVVRPVRVVAVPVVVTQPVRVLPTAVRPLPVNPGVVAAPMQPQGWGAPGIGGQRVVVRTYKITKIRYKVPKKKPAPIVCPPVCPTPCAPAPVICPPVCVPVICPPVVCCPAPMICPPICIPKRCCPIRSCR
jgi:hypothetical protein